MKYKDNICRQIRPDWNLLSGEQIVTDKTKSQILGREQKLLGVSSLIAPSLASVPSPSWVVHYFTLRIQPSFTSTAKSWLGRLCISLLFITIILPPSSATWSRQQQLKYLIPPWCVCLRRVRYSWVALHTEEQKKTKYRPTQCLQVLCYPKALLSMLLLLHKPYPIFGLATYPNRLCWRRSRDQFYSFRTLRHSRMLIGLWYYKKSRRQGLR